MAVPTGDTVALRTGMEAIKAMAMEVGKGDGLVAAGGVVAAVVAGTQAHVGVAEVQEEGINALGSIAFHSDSGAKAVVAAGGVAAVVGGMQAHVGVAKVQEEGSIALENMEEKALAPQKSAAEKAESVAAEKVAAEKAAKALAENNMAQKAEKSEKVSRHAATIERIDLCLFLLCLVRVWFF